ncbi:MAG: shikimate dehydrogenase family protein [Chitinophagaceae bacterium]
MQLNKRKTVNEKRLFGLIGHPLTHSFSKQYFDSKFKNEQIVDVFFELFDIKNIEELSSFIINTSLNGFAITIPYKQQIIPFLTVANDVVKQLNACNCVRIDNGKLVGFNTDVIGFEQSLIKDLKPQHTKALILGNGGAAAAVKYVLHKLGIAFLVVRRNTKDGCITYSDIDDHLLQSHTLIINTTPLGTYPNIEEYPNIPYQHLSSNHYLFDLVYNPTTTAFMSKGLQQNCLVKNGYEMLVIQAEENWKIWNNQ